MSAGSPIITLRLPADLLAEIDRRVDASTHTRFEAPVTRGEWIRHAIERKLSHYARSKKSKRKSRTKKEQADI